MCVCMCVCVFVFCFFGGAGGVERDVGECWSRDELGSCSGSSNIELELAADLGLMYELQLLSNAEVCQGRGEFHPALRGHPENSGGRRQVNSSVND